MSKEDGTPLGLSKSKIIAYRQCARRIWLDVNRPELVRISPATQAIFDLGHQVGEVARRIYGRGGGHLVPFEPGLGAAVEETRPTDSTSKTPPDSRLWTVSTQTRGPLFHRYPHIRSTLAPPRGRYAACAI